MSIGGITSINKNGCFENERSIGVPYIGVIEGRTERAARDVSSLIAPKAAIDAWITEQISLIDTDRLRRSEMMQLSSFLYSELGVGTHFPFAFHQGATRTTAEFLKEIEDVSTILMPAINKYNSFFEILGYQSLTTDFFEANAVSNFFVFGHDSARLLDEDDGRKLNKIGSAEIEFSDVVSKWSNGAALRSMLNQKWGGNIKCEVRREKFFLRG